MELLTWLEQTDFSTWLRESDWGYPVVLCVHAVGMGMVVGISWMYSARILGYAKHFPLAGFDKLLHYRVPEAMRPSVSDSTLFKKCSRSTGLKSPSAEAARNITSTSASSFASPNARTSLRIPLMIGSVYRLIRFAVK